MLGDSVQIGDRQRQRKDTKDAVGGSLWWDELRKMLVSSIVVAMRELNTNNGDIVRENLVKFHATMKGQVNWKLASLNNLRDQLEVFRETTDEVIDVVHKGLEMADDQMETMLGNTLNTQVQSHLAPLIHQIVQREANQAEKRAFLKLQAMEKENRRLARE